MKDFINQIEPWIDSSELDELKKVIDSTFITENKATEEFENRIKELTGSKYAIAITNGTAALYCCLKALGIGKGDEVIVPNMTFIATSNAVIMADAKPIFCEVDEKTFCISPEKFEKLINKKTKAVIPVHLYGQSADMETIMSISEKHNIFVVEDAAQGIGVRFKGKHVGSFGHMGILSFYGNKTITCGEGGIILTDSEELRDKCYILKNHGRPERGTFKHEHIGFNFAFTEMQAAIGISQMKKLPKIIDKKKQICDFYYQELSNISKELQPVFLDNNCEPVFWFTSFLCEKKNELKKFLLDKGIQTRDFFYPLHLQPCYSKIKTKGKFTISEKIYSKGISLPSSYNLTYEQQKYIIDSIREFFHDH